MTFCIRPRQDFSLARFSKILRVLHLAAIDHNPILILDPETHRCEYRIVLPSAETADKVRVVIDLICSDTDCNPSDFKVMVVE